MLVDDEVFARESIARFMQREGFSVFLAGTAKEALEICKNEKPDVIFLDLMLPDLDGDHLFPYFKELNADVDIYFMTGSGSVFTEENAKELGAAGYMQKPIFFEELAKLLTEIKLKKSLEAE
ncbi:MAG: response regulator [Endomicrobia bacterium]|nr:response regulator [Endomicrobiia bacterium]